MARLITRLPLAWSPARKECPPDVVVENRYQGRCATFGFSQSLSWSVEISSACRSKLTGHAIGGTHGRGIDKAPIHWVPTNEAEIASTLVSESARFTRAELISKGPFNPRICARTPWSSAFPVTIGEAKPVH